MASITRGSLATGLATGMLLAAAAPVAADSVNIPEGGAVTPGSVFVINFQVQEGCDGLATDTVEVVIPEEVDNPIPEDVPGWAESAEIVIDDEGNERIGLVRWFGGPLEDGLYYEFGLRAGFPDDPGATIEFPVIQRCGLAEVTSSPTVALEPRFGPRDILELAGQIDELQGQLDELAERGTGLEELEQ